MAPDPAAPPTLALNTKLEEDFVAPLTAVRGALELLHDYPDMTVAERQRFVDTALRSCAHLEKGVMELAATVYAAAETPVEPASGTVQDASDSGFASRIRLVEESGIIEIDFSDFAFTGSGTVYDFFDAIDARVADTGRRWYLVIDQTRCTVWPEAWVAFAYRGKRAQAAFGLGCARFAADVRDGHAVPRDGSGPGLFRSRAEALAYIAELREKTGD